MTELSQAVVSEIPFVPEQPRSIQVVNLPDVSVTGVGERTVKLGMHTDTTLTLLRTLASLPDKDELVIEGRVLNPEQRTKLEASRAYRFFLSSRFARAEQGGLAVVFPSDISALPDEASRWLQESFSPSSLAEEVGHGVGYFRAADLVERWTLSGRPNELLPLIGGVNQFSIGSGTLSPARLAEIQSELQRAFREQEQGRGLPLVNTALSNTFSSLLISSLPLTLTNPKSGIKEKNRSIFNIIDYSENLIKENKIIDNRIKHKEFSDRTYKK